MIPFPLQTHFWGYIPIKDFYNLSKLENHG